MPESTRERLARLRKSAYELKSETTGARLALAPGSRIAPIACAEQHLQDAIAAFSQALDAQVGA